jgi:hypothetical protein
MSNIKDPRRYQILSSRMFFLNPGVRETPDEIFIDTYKDIVLEMKKTRKSDGKQVRKTFKISSFDSKADLLKAIKDFDYQIKDENDKFMNSKEGQQRIIDEKIVGTQEALDASKPLPLVDQDIRKVIEQEKTVAQHFSTNISQEKLSKDNEIRETITVPQIFASPDFLKFQKNNSGSTFLLCGSSKSGKSTLALQMAMVWKQKYPKTIIILVNDTWRSSGGIYRPLVDEYPDDVKVVNSDKITQTIQLVKKMQSESDGKHPVLFIIDDVIGSFWSGSIKQLINTLRNLNISTLMCLQQPTMFNPQNRGSINYVIGGRLNNQEQRKKFYDLFLAGLVWNKNTAMENYSQATENYGKIFIDAINDDVKKLV